MWQICCKIILRTARSPAWRALMRVRNFKLGIVLAGLTLAATPALAQSPKAGGDAGSGARSNPSGASTGSAVDRGGGGAGGGVSSSSAGGGSTSSNTASSPSTFGASSPSASTAGFAHIRETAPSHRYSEGSSPRVSTASDGQKASPRSSGGSGSSSGNGSNNGGSN